MSHRRAILHPRANGPLAIRIGKYLDDLASRHESGGRSQSAWWVGGQPKFIADLLNAPGAQFEQRGNQAAALLAAAPQQASSGVIVLVRAQVDGGPSLAALKLVLSDEELGRFDDAAADAIVEEKITNVLPKPGDVRKGALIPHPDGAADARVVDEQLRDAAGYWLSWLGLTARPKEPRLAKQAITTIRLVVTQARDELIAGAAIADTLTAASGSAKPTTVRWLSDAAAKNAKLRPADVWAEVIKREPNLAGDRLAVSPATIGRIDTVITLDDGIVVRGPAAALAGRYRIRDAGNGWVTEIDSKAHPEVAESTRRGPTRS